MSVRRGLVACCAALMFMFSGCSGETGSQTDPARGVDSEPDRNRLGGTDHEWVGSGPKVVILGDSLTVSSRSELRERLAHTSLKIGAHFGEGLGGGPISDAVGSSVMITTSSAYALDPPEVVVIALGTNDAWNPDVGLADSVAAWGLIRSHFAGACIVGVTATESATESGYDQGTARTLNELIRSDSGQVVDWAATGTSSDLLTDDLIHLTPQGRAHRSDLIADAVDECLGTTATDGQDRLG